MKRILNYIGGQLVPPTGGAFLPNVEPATGLPYSEVPDSNGDDVELATGAAEAAFPSWSRMPVAQRSRLLLNIRAISAF